MEKIYFLLWHSWWSYLKIDNVKSFHQGQVNGKNKIVFAFASIVVLLEDTHCQVPSQRASKWNPIFCFALASMVPLLEERQCQVPALRASNWKKVFSCFRIHGVLSRR